MRAEGDTGKVIWFTLPAPSGAAPPWHRLYGATTDGPFSPGSSAGGPFTGFRTVTGKREHTAARSAVVG